MKLFVALIILIFAWNGHGKDIEKLSWLSGAWIQSHSKDKITTLTVSVLRNNKIVASEMSLEIKANGVEVRSFEKFEIRDGSPLVLEVYPQNQKSLVMKASSITPSKIVFENKKHDFPQEWSFELLKDGTLIETAVGRGRKMELKFRQSKKR